MEIKEIQLLTNDPEGTERFYNGILEVETVERTANELSFWMGKTKVTFKISGRPLRPNYHVAFDIPTNKLEEAYQWLKGKVPILPVTGDSFISDFKAWNARSFYFYDNNGNLLEFICRYDVQQTSNVPFNGKEVMHVSEIGIVTDNVPRLAEKLMAEYGIGYFDKQPPQDNFTVLGDERGLFILVDGSRNWYPTDKKGGRFWTHIKFSRSEGEDAISLWVD